MKMQGMDAFTVYLFDSLQETEVKETDFKPLRVSKTEETTFKNFQLKLIIEEFYFEDTV